MEGQLAAGTIDNINRVGTREHNNWHRRRVTCPMEQNTMYRNRNCSVYHVPAVGAGTVSINVRKHTYLQLTTLLYCCHFCSLLVVKS